MNNYFLKFCEDLKVLRRGFDYNTPIATFKPNDTIRAQIRMFDNLAGLEKIKAHINHYNTVLVDLIQRRNLEFSNLTHICTQDKIDYFSDILNRKIEHDRESILQKRQNKIYSLVDINTTSDENSWIPELHLTERENKFITNDEQICDYR